MTSKTNQNSTRSARLTHHRKHSIVHQDQTITSKQKLIYQPKPSDQINKLKSSRQMSPKERNSRSFSKSRELGDDRDCTSRRGSMNQYCVKGSEIILRQVHYIRNDNTKLLMISVDNKKYQTDTYTILFTKNVCPFNFKDTEAFVIKVLDGHNRLKSMTFQSCEPREKEEWLELYGIDIESADKLLNCCIEEIERRRFHLGVKKRNEERNSSKLALDTLVELLDSIKSSESINFSKESEWSITTLERLIQTLLNEMMEPLVPYNYQKTMRRHDRNTYNATSDARRLLSLIPPSNRLMLTSLLAHMERLSKYYLIIMSSPRTDLPQIRQNICQRLTPIIFRLQEDLDNPIYINRACELLYNLMISVNGITEHCSKDSKRT